MRSTPPSVPAVSVVAESVPSSVVACSVFPPPQPVSSIEPASTMLSIAIESFFILFLSSQSSGVFAGLLSMLIIIQCCDLKCNPFITEKRTNFPLFFVISLML